jgi:hypothetical protein
MALTKIKTGSVSDSITLTTPTISGVLTANGGAVFNEASADVDFRIESDGDANMLFVDGGNNRVGIGTGSPSAKLDVLNGGNTYTSGLLLRNGTSTSEATSLYHDNTGSTTTVLANRYGSAASAIKLVLQAASASPVTALTALGNGNVGINTISPDAVFTVDSNVGGSSTGTIARFHSSKGESDSTFLQIAATRHGTASVQRVQLQAFDDDGSTLRTLCLNNAGGAVLVGLSSPIVNPNTSTNGVTFGSNYTWVHVSDGGGQYSQRQANGNLFTFYRATSLVGTISVTASATAYNTSSDYRLKENVVPMTGSIDRVKALKPSRFNFTVDADTTVDGFLAHEAQAVVPECVTGTKDAMRDEEYEVTAAVLDDEGLETTAAVMGTRSVPDMQGIDQSKLVPLLVAALQEAIARIEILEGA